MTLFQKLFVTVVVCVMLALATLVVVSRVTIDSGLNQLIQRQDERQAGRLVERLSDYYARFGSWEELRLQPRFWNPRGAGARRQGLVPGRFDPLEERRGQQLFRRAYLLDTDRKPVAGNTDRMSSRDTLLPIEHAGQVVGFLGFPPASRPGRLPEERALAAGQNRALLIAAGATFLLAAVAAWLLARGIARPVGRIGQTVAKMAEGDFDSRSEVSGSPEIRQLARGVNGLAATLARNQKLRHEWMTEIAHELRTPVTVLRGEIAAVRDGIRQADDRTLASLDEEISHLAKLLDDLQELALSDAGALSYRFESVNLGALVTDMVEEYSRALERAGISVASTVIGDLYVQADPARIRQLLHNLLRNCLRYTDSNGSVSIILDLTESGDAVLVVDDSEPGMPPEDRERLFERFFRGANTRHTGGSGLGLAISQRIVQAHGGTITAAASHLGGLQITVTLPVGQDNDHER